MTAKEILENMAFTRIDPDGESENLIDYEWAKNALDILSAEKDKIIEELQRKVFELDYMAEFGSVVNASDEYIEVLIEAREHADKMMAALQETKDIQKGTK